MVFRGTEGGETVIAIRVQRGGGGYKTLTANEGDH